MIIREDFSQFAREGKPSSSFSMDPRPKGKVEGGGQERRSFLSITAPRLEETAAAFFQSTSTWRRRGIDKKRLEKKNVAAGIPIAVLGVGKRKKRTRFPSFFCIFAGRGVPREGTREKVSSFSKAGAGGRRNESRGHHRPLEGEEREVEGEGKGRDGGLVGVVTGEKDFPRFTLVPVC